MGVDALASSHPLSSKEEDIMTPADISQLFDSITYSKVQCAWLDPSVEVTEAYELRNFVFHSCNLMIWVFNFSGVLLQRIRSPYGLIEHIFQ